MVLPMRRVFLAVIWFTNDFDTTTSGFDLVVSYEAEMWGGETAFNFAYNHTQTEVDDFNADIINLTRIQQLESNLPEDRFTLTANHTQDNWNVLARLNYYGEFFEAHLDSHEDCTGAGEIPIPEPGGNCTIGPDLPINADAVVTVDAEFGYDFSERFRFAIGAKNLLDEYPDENPWATIVGAEYPVTSPMGFNGRFLYLRGIYNFE